MHIYAIYEIAKLGLWSLLNKWLRGNPRQVFYVFIASPQVFSIFISLMAGEL